MGVRTFLIGAAITLGLIAGGCNSKQDDVLVEEPIVEAVTPADDGKPGYCSDLDDLNSLVVDTYSNELSRIEAAAEREDKWQQKALLYLAVGNDDAALEVLKDAFFNRYFRSDTISEEDFFKCCFDLELTNDEYRQRAERDLERKENLKGVFKDFGRIGYTDKQYEVIDTLIDEGGSNKDIFNLYHELGDVEKARPYAKEIFLSKLNVWSTDVFVDTYSIKPEPSWYDELGDRFLREGKFKRAFDAYKRSENNDKIRKVLEEVENTRKDELFCDIVEYLGDEDETVCIKRKEEMRYLSKRDKGERTLSSDPSLNKRKGELCIENGEYQYAFYLFTSTGDQDGMQDVIEAYTTPAPN